MVRSIKNMIILSVVVVTLGLITFLASSWESPKLANNGQGSNTKEVFKFATVGDFDLNDNTTRSLAQINAQNVEFVLGLGDFSYGRVDEYAWCDSIKQQLGETLPFQLIAGNHDLVPETSAKSQGYIDKFATCLPNRMPNLRGIYGQQYTFDYGTARIIAIVPDLLVSDKKYTYAPGTTERTWLINAIDGAKSDNKKWVFVAMHKNCITYGVKTCEIGEDLLKLLVEKKVTLVLQGHEHAYMRSKQLQINQTTCPFIPANSFNKDCVSSDSPDQYSNKNGSIVLINGTGGVELRPLDVTKPAKDYFAAGYGSNIQPSYGPSIVTVFPDYVSVDYIDSGGVILDHFEVTE